MPANVVKRVLRHVDGYPENDQWVLWYPKDSAGSIVTMEYVDLKRSMTVEQAFERIRPQAWKKRQFIPVMSLTAAEVWKALSR